MKKIFSFLVLFLISSLSFAEPRYSIIVDAGSSGSRLHLFEYDTSTAVPVIHDIFSEKVKPGLSSFKGHPEDAPLSLKTALDKAENALKDRKVDPRSVSISVLATAGMRLLSKEDQASIYQNISDYLQGHYSFSVKAVETIPGEMEGLYDWLDINYLLNRFESKEPTVGAIDMGGASTQVVYEDSKGAFHLTLGDKRYSVSSISFLGMGLEASRQLTKSKSDYESCYPEGALANRASTFDFSRCEKVYSTVIQEGITNLAKLPQIPFIAFSGAFYTYQFFGQDEDPNPASFKRKIESVCAANLDSLKSDYPEVSENYLSVHCANAVYLYDLLYNTYQLTPPQLTVAGEVQKQSVDWTLGALLYQLVQ